MESIRFDHQVIAGIIENGSKVLDLGCGDGELFLLLKKTKHINAHGIELDENEIYKCIEKGVHVIHGDFETGLKGYPDQSFDYVILNQSMQECRNVMYVMDEALRVGKKIIVGFPNFAFYKARIMLFFRGRAPIIKSLPYQWYDTPNLHFLSIDDFKHYCRNKAITIVNAYYLGKQRMTRILPNLFAHNAIFVIQKKAEEKFADGHLSRQ
jgi:methionine biosynthesis protein MetW